ncbi:MAG: hypothetical protein M9919_15425, partial [Burkholderiaceae bacterium]|nr:hypothetical protein [Burkholderiaceae bacterium]
RKSGASPPDNEPELRHKRTPGRADIRREADNPDVPSVQKLLRPQHEDRNHPPAQFQGVP